ncbi:MAG: glycosyltransferase family 4 protein [bacterium]
MNIVQANKFAYYRGGAERHCLDLIKLLQQKGHQTGLFSMRHPKNLIWPDDDLFVSPVDFSNPKSFWQKLRTAGRMFYSFEAKRKFGQLLDRHRPDVVHVHNIYHQLSPSILAAAKKRNIPVVMTLHDFKLIAPNYLLYANGDISESTKPNRYWKVILKKEIKGSLMASVLAAKEMYFHKLFKLYENNIDLFIAPSQFMADKVREYGVTVKRLEVLPNFLPNRDLPAISDQGYALFLGRLAEEKGLETLLEAWKKLPNIPLKIAGTGPMEKELKRFAQANNLKQVEFTGHKTGQELDNLTAQARLIVFPSRWYENQPLSILEAFQYGKPVVASNQGGIPELVTDGINGILFPPKNPESLKQAVADLWSNEELRQQIRQANLEKAKQYSSDNYYQNIMGYYNELIEQRSS